jgi:predicted nucleic acid-binding protein
MNTPVSELLRTLRRAPFSRHYLSDLIDGAWSRPNTQRLVDALYVELAEQLRAPLITTDSRLASSYPQTQVP